MNPIFFDTILMINSSLTKIDFTIQMLNNKYLQKIIYSSLNLTNKSIKIWQDIF